MKLLEDKSKGKTITIEEPEAPRVVDLIEALRRSVEETKPKARTRSGSRKRRSA